MKATELSPNRLRELNATDGCLDARVSPPTLLLLLLMMMMMMMMMMMIIIIMNTGCRGNCAVAHDIIFVDGDGSGHGNGDVDGSGGGGRRTAAGGTE